MLIGQYDARISEKHQVALPKKFRQVLGEKLIITKGFEKCLIIVSEENWKTLLEGTEGKPFTNKNSRELQRFLLGNAVDIELDAKGRFVIPEFLRNHATLKTEIIFAGIQKFVEIWDNATWTEHQKSLSETITSIAQKLSDQEN
jgi:MraZ protein